MQWKWPNRQVRDGDGNHGCCMNWWTFFFRCSQQIHEQQHKQLQQMLKKYSFVVEAKLWTSIHRSQKWPVSQALQCRTDVFCWSRELSNLFLVDYTHGPASVDTPYMKMVMCKIMQKYKTPKPCFNFDYFDSVSNITWYLYIFICLNLSIHGVSTMKLLMISGYSPYKIEFQRGDTHRLKPITRTHSLRGS